MIELSYKYYENEDLTMKDLLNTEFKRVFSFSPYKSLKLNLAQMNFCKDFVSDKRGRINLVLFVRILWNRILIILSASA